MSFNSAYSYPGRSHRKNFATSSLSSSTGSSGSIGLPYINYPNNNNNMYNAARNNTSNAVFRHFDEKPPQVVIQNITPSPPTQPPPKPKYKIIKRPAKKNIEYVYYQDASENDDFYYDDAHYGGEEEEEEEEGGYYLINGKYYKLMDDTKLPPINNAYLRPKPASSQYYLHSSDKIYDSPDVQNKVYYEYVDNREPFIQQKKSSNIVYVKNSQKRQPRIVYVEENEPDLKSEIIQIQPKVTKPKFLSYDYSPRRRSLQTLKLSSIDEEKSHSKSYIYL